MTNYFSAPSLYFPNFDKYIKIFNMKLLSSIFALFSATLLLASPGDWNTHEDNQYYNIDIPAYMEVTDDLNDDATHQFQFIQNAGSKKAVEAYAIVIMETHEELAEAYEDSETEWTAFSYWFVGALRLGMSLKKFKILDDSMVIEEEEDTELPFSRAAISGKMGKLKLTFEYAVYKGKHGFYQIMAWTGSKQYVNFKSDFNRMIESFEEK